MFGTTAGAGGILIPGSTGTNIFSGTFPTFTNITGSGSISNAFDGVTNKALSSTTPFGSYVFGGPYNGNTQAINYIWLGKNYGASPQKIYKAKFYGMNNVGSMYNGTAPTPITNAAVTNNWYTVVLQGSNTAPPGSSLGFTINSTYLGSIYVPTTLSTNTSSGFTITSEDQTNTYQYVWLTFCAGFTSNAIIPASGAFYPIVSQVEFYHV